MERLCQGKQEQEGQNIINTSVLAKLVTMPLEIQTVDLIRLLRPSFGAWSLVDLY